MRVQVQIGMVHKRSVHTQRHEPAVHSLASAMARMAPLCQHRSVCTAASGSALISAKPLTASEVVLALSVAEQDASDVEDELVLLLTEPEVTVVPGGGGGAERRGRASTVAAATSAIARTAKVLQEAQALEGRVRGMCCVCRCVFMHSSSSASLNEDTYACALRHADILSHRFKLDGQRPL